MLLLKRSIAALISINILVTVFLHISGCDGSENTEESALLEKLEGKWTANSVNVDGQFVNGAFAGFSISFSGNNFNTTNGNAPIWPPSGTIALKAVSSAIGFNFVRNDEVEVTILELTESTLVLQFQHTEINARQASVGGEYTFELQR